MSASTRAVVAALFFLFMFLSGLWLSRSGRPLNTGISTVHKLVSLAAGVFLIVSIHQLNRADPLDAAQWVAIVVTGLLFVGDVATGGVLSFEKPRPTAVLRLHQVFPVLTAVSTGVMLYLLLGA
jgi:uncharacterized membrane protein YhiD involved in acid resistance